VPTCPLATRRTPSSIRPAFTLLEVMLVLALMVVMAAIVWPAFDKPFASQRLHSAGDMVKAEWMRTRVRAMTTGLTHAFRFQPETGQFQIECVGGLDAELEATQAMDFGVPIQPSLPTGETDMPGLPEGVVFLTSQTMLDTRGMMVQSQVESTAPADSSNPIYFYPDGTTSDAQLLLRNEHELYVMVQLRGLTGVTTVSDVLTAEELPQ
jgi:prepilin-type N-terminal cleavage/methylation domain-containing protein